MQVLQDANALWAATVQMTSTTDWRGNLAKAARYVEEAADSGARLIALPENFGFEPGEQLPHAQSRKDHFLSPCASLLKSTGWEC